MNVWTLTTIMGILNWKNMSSDSFRIWCLVGMKWVIQRQGNYLVSQNTSLEMFNI